jgi:hypothetical protein
MYTELQGGTHLGNSHKEDLEADNRRMNFREICFCSICIRVVSSVKLRVSTFALAYTNSWSVCPALKWLNVQKLTNFVIGRIVWIWQASGIQTYSLDRPDEKSVSTSETSICFYEIAWRNIVEGLSLAVFTYSLMLYCSGSIGQLRFYLLAWHNPLKSTRSHWPITQFEFLIMVKWYRNRTFRPHS